MSDKVHGLVLRLTRNNQIVLRDRKTGKIVCKIFRPTNQAFSTQPRIVFDAPNHIEITRELKEKKYYEQS